MEWNHKNKTEPHEKEMQILWIHSPAQTVPSIWKDMCSMKTGQPLQRYAEVVGRKEYTSLTHKWNSTMIKMKLIRLL